MELFESWFFELFYLTLFYSRPATKQWIIRYLICECMDTIQPPLHLIDQTILYQNP